MKTHTLKQSHSNNNLPEEALFLHGIFLYQADIDRFYRWMEEYPVATEVWFYLREQGFNEAITAGIIGNI